MRQVDAATENGNISRPEDGRCDPPRRLTPDDHRLLRSDAGHKAVEPQQAGRASKRRGYGRHQEKLEPERIACPGYATEAACGEIRQTSDRIVSRSLRAERVNGYGEPPGHQDVERRSNHEHSGAPCRLVGKSADHFLPIAETDGAGEHEVACPGEKVMDGKQPGEVAQVGAGPCGVGCHQGQRARGEIDQRSTGVHPAVRSQGGEMIAGELGRRVAAQPCEDAVTDALVQQNGQAGTHDSHADDGGFAVLL